MTDHKNGSIEGGRNSRAQIVKLLRKPRTVNEMAEALSLHRSVTGWHLNKLEAMGIVRRAEKVSQIQIWELATHQATQSPPHAIGSARSGQV